MRIKKILKITGYIFLGVILLLGIFVGFLRVQYNKASKSLAETNAEITNSKTEFFRFEMRQDSISEISLLPMPQKLNWTAGQLKWTGSFHVEGKLTEAATWVETWLSSGGASDNPVTIRFVAQPHLGAEAYSLMLKPNGIEIRYGDSAGAYYGIITLSHLRRQYPEVINCLEIEDKPDLPIRGYMLDISRDKVPKIETLKELVDKLSKLKYNHLELYVEGFSFGYPSFRDLWEATETPVTPEEIKELDAYCKSRFIELVPNQNSLGHMQAWLDTPEYEHLAECPDGYEIMPMRKMKTTLDPSKPGSIELIEKMMDDMLPHFSSSKFNANLDEPFELGHCNNEDLAAEVGVGKIYLDFVLKVYQLTKSRGKEMWMWGDIIGKHPELLENMPKDITVLEWGYEAEHPFLKNTERIDKAGLPFLVCPGTSSWMTLTGRTDNMLGNIENAIQSAVANGGKGMLLTDWGDMGHWQYLPVSYPGIAYAGAVSWNSRSSRIVPLERYLNTHIFEGSDPALAGIVMNIGRSYHFEERHLPNSSHNFLAYQFGIMDPVLEATIFEIMRKKLPELVGDSAFNIMAHRFDDKKPFKYEALGSYLDGLESDLNARIGEMDLQPNYLETDTLVRHEVRNGIAMVRLGASVRQYSQQKTSWSSEERIQFLSMMEANLSQLKEEHQRLWLERNKSGGLERSMEAMDKLELQIKDQLEIEQGSAVRRSANEFKDKVIAGGASWYLSD